MLSNKTVNWIQSKTGLLNELQINILSDIEAHFKKNQEEELTKELFNKLHNKNKQKLLGITYTPYDVRKELTTRSLIHLLNYKELNDVRICDPCCGSGLFSLTLLQELINLGLTPKKALEENIFFSDIDADSVAVSMINIATYLSTMGIDATEINLNATVGDFLKCNQKYDAFITNPPYVKLQNLTQDIREYLRENYPLLFVGALGLSAIFLKRMFDNLNENGIVSVITQNNFFTSNSGVKLRKFLQYHIEKIDTFGSEPIFEGVTAYTCLLYVSKSTNETFEYRKIESLAQLNSQPSNIKNSNLNPFKWRLGSPSELEDLATLEREGTPLKAACRIWVGIATQFDKAFTVFKNSDGWYGISKSNKIINIEEKIVRPLIKVADLNTEQSLLLNNRGVIYPYEIIKNKTVVYTEDFFSTNYPNAYKLLESWKEELLKREKGRILKENWYKWGRIQSMIPTKNKLLTKTFNQGPCFYHDKTDSLFSNGYAISTHHNNYDLMFVQKVLNSKVFYYYARLTSFEIEGGYQCYQKNFIENFCLPNIPIEKQRILMESENIDDFLIDYYKLNYKITD